MNMVSKTKSMSIFNKIKLSRPKRSLHNLSYPLRASLGFGDLVPIICEKVVPGDKFSHSHEFLMRFSPFVSQVYQSFNVRVDYFFVPSRLLWDNFTKFLVEDDSTVYPHPQIPLSYMYDGASTMENTLVDYIVKVSGKPTYTNGVFSFSPLNFKNSDETIDCLPFAAILKVFLDYYADENLFVRSYNGNTLTFQEMCDAFEGLIALNGTSYADALMELYSIVNDCELSETRELFKFFKKAYPKDYFTSALPWAQRGPIVQIPLNGSGDVEASVYAAGSRTNYSGVLAEFNASPTASEQAVTLRAYGRESVHNTASTDFTALDGASLSGVRTTSAMVADANEAKNAPEISFKAVNINGTATITDLRTAMTVQAWLEKNARAGVRYKEQLAAHFGVRSRDYRLQRAELLQTSKSHISIGEVFTTAQDDAGDFIPGLGVATATGSAAVRPFKKFFEEHGYFIGFMSVFPKAAYSQGLPRQLLELDKFDYYWPEFQHIGEQEIYNCEVFLSDGLIPNRNKEVFGYTPRYAHYKTRNAEVHGDLLNTLNFMTASRQFTSLPRLNDDFVSIRPEHNHLYRVFNAVGPFETALPVQVDFFHKFKAVRPMSYFGSPRII